MSSFSSTGTAVGGKFSLTLEIKNQKAGPCSPWLVKHFFRENGPGGVMQGAGGPYSGPDEPGLLYFTSGYCKRGFTEFYQLQPALPPCLLNHKAHRFLWGNTGYFTSKSQKIWGLNTEF
jgi:hypothetical protein